ncbi:MAG: integrase [Dethiobacter sp.]|nr:MAG: integrase [Dethiobacter sp.]
MASGLINEYLEKGLRGKSQTTIKTYHHALLQFENWLQRAGTDLKGFTRTDVQQYVDYLAAHKKSAATINKVFNAIKSFCRWYGKKEFVEDIIVVKQPNILLEAPKALEKAERHWLAREVDRDGSRRNYAIVISLLNTGIRLSELVALDRDDIDISERKGTLRVRSGKGNRERVIPLNAETRRALTKYLEERTDGKKPLFLSNRFRRISPRTVQHIMEGHGFNVHQLRHTFITGLVRAKEDLSTIQSLSGHKSADMILRYSKPTEADKQQAVERLYQD